MDYTSSLSLQEQEHSFPGTAPRLMMMGLEGIEKYIERIRAALVRQDYVAKRQAVERAEQLVQHLLVNLEEEILKDVLVRLDRLYRYLLLKLAHCNLFNDQEALSRCDAIIADLRLEWSLISRQAGSSIQGSSRLIDFNDMFIG